MIRQNEGFGNSGFHYEVELLVESPWLGHIYNRTFREFCFPSISELVEILQLIPIAKCSDLLPC
jgi:hypothetical protein